MSAQVQLDVRGTPTVARRCPCITPDDRRGRRAVATAPSGRVPDGRSGDGARANEDRVDMGGYVRGRYVPEIP